MRTLILCGGKGTRAYPRTLELPKPLMEVGGRPVLEHVMEIYARQGFTDFVLAAGFKVELIEAFAASLPSDWRVEVADTGEDTNTGGRVARCAGIMGDPYFVTYADGLGDVDLRQLADFHSRHRGAATVTSVPLPSQYGTIETDASGRVQAVSRETATRGPLDQRRLSRLGPAGVALVRGGGSRTGRAARAGFGRPAVRLPPSAVLALDGHLQGRARAHRVVRRRVAPLGHRGRRRLTLRSGR